MSNSFWPYQGFIFKLKNFIHFTEWILLVCQAADMIKGANAQTLFILIILSSKHPQCIDMHTIFSLVHLKLCILEFLELNLPGKFISGQAEDWSILHIFVFCLIKKTLQLKWKINENLKELNVDVLKQTHWYQCLLGHLLPKP